MKGVINLKKAKVNYERTVIQLANNAADELEEDEDIRVTQQKFEAFVSAVHISSDSCIFGS